MSSNPYYTPEDFGLTILGEIEWSEPDYSFDFGVVWVSPETKELFYAEDSGCSCPSPFEDFETLDSLTKLNGWAALDELLTKKIDETWPTDGPADRYVYSGTPPRDKLVGEAGELVQKAREATR